MSKTEIHMGPGQEEITDLIEAAKRYFSGRSGEGCLDRAEATLRRCVAELAAKAREKA